MPRLRRRGHHLRQNSLHPLPETFGETERACALASLEDLLVTLAEVENGEHDICGNPWRTYGAKLCIGRELMDRFKLYCKTAPANLSAEEVEKAARRYRMPGSPNWWRILVTEGLPDRMVAVDREGSPNLLKRQFGLPRHEIHVATAVT